MSFSLPPVVRLAERLLTDIEKAVKQFSRDNRNGHGTELRAAARAVVRYAYRAWRERERRSKWSRKLVNAVDKLKVELQLGQRLRSFRSFAQFEALARLAAELGRQSGGWHRQQITPNGQNRARNSARERAEILSTHAASPSKANA